MKDVVKFKFKKFSKIVTRLCESAKIPLYSHFRANKTYTNFQHLFLLVAKQDTRCTYRAFIEMLYDSKIPKYIGLKKIPHFTTLQKVSERLNARFFYDLIFQTKFLFKKQGTIWGADSTGMELDHASHHYCRRINREKSIKGFVNFNAISDLYNKNIIVVKIRKKRRHDCSDFIPMYNQIKNEDFDYFVADKGYDADKNHEAIFESGKHSLISLKNYALPINRTSGRYRKQAKRQYEPGIYSQRSLTETIFSSIKRKYGPKLRARKYKTQKIELLTKILCYNIDRATRTALQALRIQFRILQSLTTNNPYKSNNPLQLRIIVKSHFYIQKSTLYYL